MAFTILNQVGDRPKAVIATTILSYSLSSILTGAVFFALGYLKLGSLTGFFPRHILVGCIGGVGWFLVATGLEVSARLEGNLNYNLETLQLLVGPATLVLWTVPLLLAIILIIIQRFIKHPLIVPLYFLSIPAVFYLVVLTVPNLNIALLRDKGWIFELPQAGVPFYHFYTLYGQSLYYLTGLNGWLYTDIVFRLRRGRLEGTCQHCAGHVCFDILWNSSCAHKRSSVRSLYWGG